MKKIFLLLTGLMIGASLFADNSGYTIVEDTVSTYTPTVLQNGDFEIDPGEMNTIPCTERKTDEGWRTTDDWIEWRPTTDSDQYYENSTLKNSGQNTTNFIEMNAEHEAVLSQDLTTTGGDIIKWSLIHGARITYNSYEQMFVEIGAPEMNGTEIVYATGPNNSNTSRELNSHINESTKAVYSYTGVSGVNGYANAPDLAKLYLNNSSSEDYSSWHYCQGVYIVPDGQTVTRFGFIGRNSSYNRLGNYLDNVTFTTLLGNLSAKFNETERTVTVKGFWGETDNSKKMIISIDGNTIAINDISNFQNKNFIVTIDESMFEDAETLFVYHEDFEAAKKTVNISRAHRHGTDTYTDWTSSNTLPVTAGRYVLTRNVVLTEDVTIPEGVIICMNGKKISGAKVSFAGNAVLDNCSTTYVTDSEGAQIESVVLLENARFAITDYLCIDSLVINTNARIVLDDERLTEYNDLRICITDSTPGIITEGKVYSNSNILGDFIYLKSTNKALGLGLTYQNQLIILKR